MDAPVVTGVLRAGLITAGYEGGRLIGGVSPESEVGQ